MPYLHEARAGYRTLLERRGPEAGITDLRLRRSIERRVAARNDDRDLADDPGGGIRQDQAQRTG